MPAVRLASPDDAGALAHLRWESRSQTERAREPQAGFLLRFRDWFRRVHGKSGWHAAVAQTTAGVCGCMYLQIVPTVPVPGVESRAWGYVTHAFVREEHRRSGLGTAMLELLVRQGREVGLTELHVWPSIRAASLYVRAGFMSPERQRACDPEEEPSYVLPLGGGGM